MTKVDSLAKTLWGYLRIGQKPEKSDLILVLGSNDVRVAEYGAELFHRGFAPSIVLSGNVGELTRGLYNKPEAEVFAEVAVQAGVPKDRILIESESRNTGENISFTKDLLESKGIKPKRIIIVQKPYMERRAWATAKKVWPKMDSIISSPNIPFENYPTNKLTSDQVVNIMVGDLQRIVIYPQKGFQIYQEVPEKVERAYEKLIELGFTRNLISDNAFALKYQN